MIYVGFQKQITESDKQKYNLELEKLKKETSQDKYCEQNIDYSKIKLTGTGKEFPVMIANTREELENNIFIEFSKIEQVDFAEMYNGKIYLNKEELQKAKEQLVRSVKNNYLEKYIDGIISNDVRWAEMKETEQKKYLEYRKYLVDYSDTENWFESFPKTWNEYFNLGDNNV